MSYSIRETMREIKTKNFAVLIEVVNFCDGSHWLADLYEKSDHIAGTTIKCPDYLARGEAQHYIGQVTPRELAKDYAKQGRKNPSAEAYESLQDELAHYIQTNDCTIEITIKKAGVEIASALTCCFDYCGNCGGCEHDLVDYAKKYAADFNLRDAMREAVTDARATLERLAA